MAIPRPPPHPIRALPKAPSSTVWGFTTLDPVDVWNFEYFRVVYVRKLSLYLRTNVWEKLILQAAPTERYILDGAVAIGALSRNLVPSRDPRQPAFMPGHTTGYSLNKYSLALKELSKRLNSQTRSPEAALLGSLIFIAFELEQGDFDAARVHLSSALAILNGTDEVLIADENMRTDMAHVLHAFSDLDLQGLAMPQPCPLGGLPTLPSIFESINEARDSLNSINGVMNCVFQKWTHSSELYPSPPLSAGLSQDISTLMRHLESWREVFGKSNITECLDSKEAACALSLLLVHEVISISALTFFSSNETAYDTLLSRFVSVTQFAEELLGTDDVERIAALESASDPQFDVAVIQPLFFVACKCRDPETRRRAVRIMARTKMGGFYDTRLQIKAACWIIDTEERDTRQDVFSDYVREEDRLHGLRLDVDAAAESCRISAWRRSADGQLSQVLHILYAS
ncbi:hypothetical protein FSARC_7793 [Fusarium sarcochroum]|uniref:Uncharacterized protein n=1 Tax=Fusarium sarcochroum TaxID=1208366 RepID=A0A8H4TUM2_9HYPO|nr:hypothetical protein FSARC_7793 [Fusarium sarcochroum]